MRQLGWVEGRNMAVERRFGESADQFRTGAADLVRLKVDVLFVGSAGLAKFLQLETKTIPIVVGRAEGDLVARRPWWTASRSQEAISQGHRSSTMISFQGASSFSRRSCELFQGRVPSRGCHTFGAPPDTRSVRSTGRDRRAEPRHRGSCVHRAPSRGHRYRFPRYDEESRAGCSGDFVDLHVRASKGHRRSRGRASDPRSL